MAAPPLCRRVERRDATDGAADVPLAAGPSSAADDASIAGTITLDETDRHRRRLAMTSDQGLPFVLSLDAATLLRDGDRLLLDDGRRILVRAAPEPLYEVRGTDAHHLLRLAWHMGNRHLPTQLMADHLRIRRDAVIGAMLRGLGADVRDVEAGFDPEGGAYGDAHDHGHGHDSDGPDHDVGQSRRRGRGRGHDHSHGHGSDGHGHDLGKGHGHDRGHG